MKSKRTKFYRVIAQVYDDVLVRKYKDRHFWVLSAFILTFSIARLLVHFYPSIFLQVRGTHVHHFTYGIVLLAISGYMAIVRSNRAPVWLALIFGVGLALAVDEAGMWLHLTDYYYNDTSEDAIILVGVILVNIVYLREFWMKLIKAIVSWVRNI